MQHDLLADALSAIKNAERVGKNECVVKSSKLIKEVLKVMSEHNYIGKFERIYDSRGEKVRVELLGKIIDTNVVKPRFSIRLEEFEKWEKRLLPAKSFGILIISTPKGIMDQNKAKELHSGGKILAFCY